MSTENPVSNGVMHCWVVAPQRSFCTRYLPPATAWDPNGWQIGAAAAGAATVVVAGTATLLVGAATDVAVAAGGAGFGVAAIPTAFPTRTAARGTIPASPAAIR